MELFRALGSLAEPPLPATGMVADALELGPLPTAADHSDLFDLQLPPYASVYLGSDGMLGGEARDRIAGFWRALDLAPPAEPDHLTVMLAFHARLTELESEATAEPAGLAWRRARKAFLWEHLASWLPLYLAKVRDVGGSFYVAWADLLEGALRAEAADVGPTERLSLHLREAGAMVDPRRSGLDEFTDSLLSPARSGMILTRSDFRRGSDALGTGLRIAERRVVLRTLLGQDAHGTLGWLAAEAGAWANRHRGWAGVEERSAGFWTSRAEDASRLLNELAAEQGSGVRADR
jgi:TorA maturation chaperone TorD